MTPEQILDALRVQDGVPRDAMVAAGECREEMMPLFLACINRLCEASFDTLDEADSSAFLFIYFLLGEWRDPRAYRPLTALLRQKSEVLDHLLGDAVTEGTARVIAGVCDDDLQPIIDVIEDPVADEFVRAEMISALALIARFRPQARQGVVAYLERFFVTEFEKTEFLWGSWAFAVAELGLAQLEPQVREAFEREWISPDEADLEIFQRELRAAIEGTQSPWLTEAPQNRLIDSAIDELSDWYFFSDEDLEATAMQHDPAATALMRALNATVARTTPKVGRNDPCPCGSGKKYKKCCLQ